jgi:hypothetical protein
MMERERKETLKCGGRGFVGGVCTSSSPLTGAAATFLGPKRAPFLGCSLQSREGEEVPLDPHSPRVPKLKLFPWGKRGEEKKAGGIGNDFDALHGTEWCKGRRKHQ